MNMLRQELQAQPCDVHADIRRLDEAIRRLNDELRSVSRGISGGPGQFVSAQDSALELMAQQVAVISYKANEVDTLKITIEIMKNKIQRLEDATAVSLSPPSTESYASALERPLSYASPPIPQFKTEVRLARGGQAHHSQAVIAAPEDSHNVEPSRAQDNWAAANAGTKRARRHSIESSPKRYNFARIQPRTA